jgi:hypothetical protein
MTTKLVVFTSDDPDGHSRIGVAQLLYGLLHQLIASDKNDRMFSATYQKSA